MKKRLILLLTGVVIIVIGVFFSLYYQGELNPDNETANQAENTLVPEDQFKGVELVFYNSDGSTAWYLESEQLDNFGQKKELDLFPVEITAVKVKGLEKGSQISIGESNLLGEILYNLTAAESSYYLDSGLIKLAGPIKINKEEIIFETGKINWQDGNDRLKAAGGVSIDTPDFYIKGENLEADLELNNVIVSGKEQEPAYFSWKKGSDSD